jgi:hypothetical protein
MVKQFLNKLEWFDTRFPRIPVPVQKEITDYFEQLEKYTIGHEDVQVAEKNAKKEEQKQRSRDKEAIPVRRDKDRYSNSFYFFFRQILKFGLAEHFVVHEFLVIFITIV